MNKSPSKHVMLIPLFVMLTLVGCGGKKASSPTSFKLSGLSALAANGSSVPGGLVLMGTNGTDRFTAAIGPSEISTFQLDLPAGSWNFSAIAWQGVDPLTGATQCGLSAAKVEGDSMVVSLNLSTPDCQRPEFASPESISQTTHLGSFKQLTLNSCLNPMGKSADKICDGTDVATRSDLPGESLSFRLQVSSGSSFGATLRPLTSKCYNLDVIGGNILKGEFVTNLRIPHGGTINMPMRILGYESFDCRAEDLAAVYPITGGLHGLGGVERTTFTENIEISDSILLSIADNFVGTIGSPFLDGLRNHGLDLPFASCGANCFNTTDNTQRGDLWSATRDAVWSLFGSPDGRNSFDFEPGTTSPGSVTFSTSQNPDVGIIFTTTPGTATAININSLSSLGQSLAISCSSGSAPSEGMLNISYDEAATLMSAIVMMINSEPSCSTLLQASLINEGTGSLPTAVTLQPTFTQGPYIPKRRELGSLRSAAHTLIGPVGAVFAKNGITTFTQMCNAGNLSYSLPFPSGEIVKIDLLDATSLATFPPFPSSIAGRFEKKVLISFNSRPEEAIYFNCNANKGLGAVVDREVSSEGSYIEQTFWDVRAAEMWTEKVSYSEYQNDMGLSESWRSFQSAQISAGIVKLWNISGSSNFQQKFASYVDNTVDSVYIKDSQMLSPSDPLFLTANNDLKYAISTGEFFPNSTTNNVTEIPYQPGLIQDTSSDIFFQEDPLNPANVWDFTF